MPKCKKFLVTFFILLVGLLGCEGMTAKNSATEIMNQAKNEYSKVEKAADEFAKTGKDYEAGVAYSRIAKFRRAKKHFEKVHANHPHFKDAKKKMKALQTVSQNVMIRYIYHIRPFGRRYLKRNRRKKLDDEELKAVNTLSLVMEKAFKELDKLE